MRHFLANIILIGSALLIDSCGSASSSGGGTVEPTKITQIADFFAGKKVSWGWSDPEYLELFQSNGTWSSSRIGRGVQVKGGRWYEKNDGICVLLANGIEDCRDVHAGTEKGTIFLKLSAAWPPRKDIEDLAQIGSMRRQ